MKFRTALLLGSVFGAGLLTAPLVGVVRQDLGLHVMGAAQAQAQSGDAATPANDRAETYRLLSKFGDVFERIRADYVEKPGAKDLIENAINGMLTGLDPHSSYMNANSFRDMQVQTKGEFGGLGIEVTQDGGYIKVISPIDDTPASRAGIKPGDLIVAIDGQSVQGLSLNEAVDKMRGAPNTKIVLIIRREGADKPLEVTLTREKIRIQVVKSRLLDGNIAYVRLASFTESANDEVRKAIASLRAQAGGKLRGIVLDMRNNPGGLLDQAIAVSNDFIDKGEIVSTRARHSEDSQRWNARGGAIAANVPMVVLINGGSASASEIVAGALQDHHRAIVIGTRSFGKGSVQTVIPLPGDTAMRLTTARYYTPSGRSIQNLGITPDVEVRATRAEDAGLGQVREASLKGTIKNPGGTAPDGSAPRNDLPAIVASIPKLPPENQPAYDPAKPDTDFQLQQALKVLQAMPVPAGSN